MRRNRFARKSPACLLAFRLILFVALAPLPLTTASAQTPERTRLLTQPEVKTLPSREKRWALIIGVDKYEDDNITPLRGATNDANALARALKDYAGFNENQIIVLTNEQPRTKQPTRLNILRYLSNLKTVVPPDGLLFVSFSGHGIERNNRAFLIPADAVFTEDIRLLQQTAISVDEIREDIKETGVGQVLILLDACRNDPVSGKADSINLLTGAYLRGFDFDTRNREVTAFATLYATSVGARAYENADKKEGYFTLAVVEALSGKAADPQTHEVTLQNLVRYIEETVPTQVAINLGGGRKQRPFAVIEGYKADELVLAFGNSAKPEAPPSPSLLSGERAFWQAVESSDTREAYESFLKAYPKGEYAAVAAFKLERLKERLAQAAEYQQRGLSQGASYPDEAIASFTKAIELDPGYVEAYKSRGDTYSAMKRDYDRAIADYTKAIELNPKDIGAYNDRGIAYENKQELDRAIADYTRAIELDPKYSSAYFNRGRTHKSRGNYEQAIADFTRVIELKDIIDTVLAYIARGNVYLVVKDYERALADFSKVIGTGIHEEDAYGGRGQYYFARQEYEQAIADFTKAIELEPFAYYAHNYYNKRGLAYFARKDYDRAIADYTKAIELYGADATVYRNRANAYEAKGDAQRAGADRRKAGDLEKAAPSPASPGAGNNSAPSTRDDARLSGSLFVDLDYYCKSTYGAASHVVSLEKNAFGWKCETMDLGGQKSYANINITEACQKQYGPSVVGKYRNYNDANSWYCVENR